MRHLRQGFHHRRQAEAFARPLQPDLDFEKISQPPVGESERHPQTDLHAVHEGAAQIPESQMKDFSRARADVSEAETEAKVAALAKFIESATADYRAQGLPVGEDGRIKMEGYALLYGESVRDDIKETPPADPQRLNRSGEMLECLAYALLLKNLGNQFIVARSSHHDDRFNHVDTILLDKQTGNLVCTFDEVGDTNSQEYIQKQKEVAEQNTRGGSTVKYALELKEVNGKKIAAPAGAEHVPLFYIALSQNIIKEGVRKFRDAHGEQSDFEKQIFAYFAESISAQIQGLELEDKLKSLHPKLKERLLGFKNVIEVLRGKRAIV